ncbi:MULTISPECIES: zf-HC2 domain-containing protein [Curtobacterium]|jgi:anti-sigma factor (TIGR02949 family)|uniref:Zf-HC2 domain-containing protein n=1 Tax=Curtobacterium citreum TaxID=2036 RepID=A0ABU8YB68_9MICO|nr:MULTISPECIES: zf-HC2 domain-containing protein [Curtobacterium]NQW89505.1 zf-HC2 domain-containing protein [Curtobacterium sp. VKM Ac-2861]PZO58406.1 MAG: alpha-ketoglutarate decarboxylase [Leifsonia xyli]MBF4586347.1 zf-HC2 domain-containing protein [Curtobacterium sp. VKM Ac-2887]MBF4604419.1 zf-HC2 domain-containing protein [Curtobacterium sp. VKM Ac-2884]MBT1623826.1 zf-HC2 domain-containing protein [Curtobacterium flaccumfaciens pv. oortii]
MSGCDCSKAKAELEEFLHGELCREDAADIREHMDDCEDCTTEHRVGVVLIETVRRACKETAPEELRGEILARIRLEQSTH